MPDLRPAWTPQANTPALLSLNGPEAALMLGVPYLISFGMAITTHCFYSWPYQHHPLNRHTPRGRSAANSFTMLNSSIQNPLALSQGTERDCQVALFFNWSAISTYYSLRGGEVAILLSIYKSPGVVHIANHAYTYLCKFGTNSEI